MKVRAMAALGAMAAAALFMAVSPAHAGGLAIHFIDVGEGDSILLETFGPEKKFALIDTGNLTTGYKAARYLDSLGVKRLDYLILTHPHPDHMGGSFMIAQMFGVGKFFDNGEGITRQGYKEDMFRWYAGLVRDNSRYRALQKGDALPLGEALLEVLWPDTSDLGGNYNANSLVIMLRYGKFRALLSGDLIIKTERKLLARRAGLKADVLKVGHHGAVDALSAPFLEAVSPKAAVISVNKDNIRNYPDPATVDRIMQSGAKLYRTDIDGDIVVRAEKSGKFGITTGAKGK